MRVPSCGPIGALCWPDESTATRRGASGAGVDVLGTGVYLLEDDDAGAVAVRSCAEWVTIGGGDLETCAGP